MSRSGYTDDGDDQWQLIRWRGAVASALRGRRGQAFLNEMLAAMDALPEKKLVVDEIETADGAVCAIGAVGRARGVDMKGIDPHDPPQVAGAFGIASALAQEIVYMNDEWFSRKTPGERFALMRTWIKDEIWSARGCVDDPFGKRALSMSKRLHWKAVIEWNEV
jgi:hypothetical protein